MLLDTRKICKQFNGVYALKDVDFSIKEGEVHGLVGENGAGKSTLIKILTGVYSHDSGEIIWEGKSVQIDNPRQSKALGINVIHQDRQLIPSFNGVENAYLGLDYEKKPGGLVDWTKMKKNVNRVMKELGIQIDLSLPASLLSPPQQTLLEICRSMMTTCKLLILDEPTASLTDKETEILFEIINRLKKQGTSILYVTHRMEEVFRLTDRITILKNGQMAGTVNSKEMTKDKVISMMTDNWTSSNIVSNSKVGNVVLSVEHISSKDNIVKDASLKVHAGEILGIFGLGGSGRTELLESIYGFRPICEGNVIINGKNLTEVTPQKAIQNGIVLICEDRRGMALITSFSVRKNITLSVLPQYTRKGVLDEKKEVEDVKDKIKILNIKTNGSEQTVSELSGGNQQKVVFAKALESNPKVLLCDEPTQAVDVKTRYEIHKLLRTQADEGNAIIFVSSDLKEVLEVADSIQILSHGKTKDLFKNEGLTSEQVLKCCYAD